MSLPGPSAAFARMAEAAGETTVLVVGDVMLDEHVLGDVERTSPEAPVPVVRVRERTVGPGGAANVARQLAALGARVHLAGAVGADVAGRQVLAACEAQGIGTSAIVELAGRPTTHKQRVLAGNQQLLRVDTEQPAALEAADERAVVAAIEALPVPDVVVVSDYAKGVVTEVVFAAARSLAQAAGAPLLVDPKRPDLAHYRGATLIKANRNEFEAAIGAPLGDDPVAALCAPAAALVRGCGLEHLVVTLGELGMAVVDASGSCTAVEQRTAEVFDVSGAGDTVLAALALAAATGIGVVDGAEVASAAAGVVVRRSGVAVASVDDIRAALAGTGGKVLAPGDAAVASARWRAEGRAVVFTNGCFDLFHAGHLHLLHEAAAMGDALIVGINSDRSVRALKGPSRPVVGERDRAALLAALDGVDAVVVFDEDDPSALIEAVRPSVLVKGGDYDPADIVGREAVERDGGRVATVPLLEGWSTTSIVDRLQGEGER